jgi:tetratricopeptide (TPR) repeat protein
MFSQMMQPLRIVERALSFAVLLLLLCGCIEDSVDRAGAFIESNNAPLTLSVSTRKSNLLKFDPSANLSAYLGTNAGVPPPIARGIALWVDGELSQSKHEFDIALKLNPDDGPTHILRAQISYMLGAFDDAINDLNQAEMLIPKSVLERHELFSRLLFETRAHSFYSISNWLGAITNFDAVIDMGVGLEKALDYRGEAHLQLGLLSNAISDFSRVIQLNPTNSAAYNGRGNAYRLNGTFDEAISDYDRAITVSPGYSELYYNRALAHEGLGEWQKAIVDYSKVVELDPEDIEAILARARIGYISGNLPQSIADYRQAIRRRGNPHDYNDLAWILSTCPNDNFRNGQEAVVLALRACEMTKQREADFLDTLAAAYAESKNFKKAIAVINQAIEVATMYDAGKSEEFKKRLALYETGVPYREKSPGEWSSKAR